MVFFNQKSRQMGLQVGLIPSQINEKKISINQFMFSNLTWILVFCQLYETVDATNASCIIGWQIAPNSPRVVSFTSYIAQILVQSHFELVSWVLALEATGPVSKLVTQMAVELINNHLISVQQKR